MRIGELGSHHKISELSEPDIYRMLESRAQM